MASARPKYQVVHEDEHHFLVHDGKEKFRVAKKGLSQGMIQKIQHFAHGGEVQAYADGGEVKKPEFLRDDTAMDDAAALATPPMDFAPPDTRSGQAKLNDELTARDRQQNETTAKNLGNIANSVSNFFQPEKPSPFGPLLNAPPEQFTPQPAASGPPAIPTNINVQEPSAAQQAQLAASGLPGVPSELGQGEKQELKGIQAAADAAKTLATNQTAVQDQYIAQKQALDDAFNKRMSEHQARSEQLFNDVLSSKVDPSHYYSSLNTGQRIGSGIAMILGGIGAGLTGGPNLAAEILNKQIDRDIDAQKMNLDNKRTLLGHYMQQGRDMQQAHQLAKADLLDITAAQLQRAASSVAGQQAQATAQMQSGQLRMQAATLRQEAEARSIQNESAKLGMQFQRAQMQAMGQFMGAQGGSGGGGAKLDPRAIALLPKELQERIVSLPDGSYATARTKEEAQKVAESMAGTAKLRDKLQRYQNLLKSGHPSTLDRGTAKAMHADILSEIGHLHDLNRLSDVDLELFKQQVPDISDFIKPQAEQKLKALGQSIDDKVWETNQTYLNLPRKRRPGG